MRRSGSGLLRREHVQRRQWLFAGWRRGHDDLPAVRDERTDLLPRHDVRERQQLPNERGERGDLYLIVLREL
jgi:hypothetical protein